MDHAPQGHSDEPLFAVPKLEVISDPPYAAMAWALIAAGVAVLLIVFVVATMLAR